MKQTTPIYAGRAERFFAYLIDTIILAVPGALVVSLLKGAEVAIIGVFLISLAYYTYFTASAWQATLGKRMLNLYVARADKKALTPRDALERFLAFILPTLPVYTSFIPEKHAPVLVFWLTMVWFSPILFRPDRTGLHDRLCNTHVLVGKVGA